MNRNSNPLRKTLVIFSIALTCSAFLMDRISVPTGSDLLNGRMGSIAATLGLVKTVSNATPLTGETFTYTLQYSCASTTDDCQGMYITDPLPPEVEFVSLVGSAHTTSEVYNSGSHTVTFTFADPLVAGSSGQVLVLVRFPNGTTPNGTVANNIATIDATNASSVTTPAISATASATWQINIEKYLGAGGAAGQTISYGFQICNGTVGDFPNGRLDLTNITIVDTLPAGTILLDVINSATTHTYDPVAHAITFTFTEDIASGYCRWPKITLGIPNPPFTVGSSITNTAWVNYTPLGESPQTEFDEQTHVLTTNLITASSYKDGTRTDRYPGQDFEYLLSLDIDGTDSLQNFCLHDTIPPEMEVFRIHHGEFYYGGLSGPDSAVTITYNTNLGGPFTISGSPFVIWEDGFIDVVNDLGLTIGGPEYITDIHWCFGTGQSGFTNYKDIRLQVLVRPGTPVGTVTNCSSLSTTAAGATLNTDCYDVNILAPYTGFRPSPTKSIKDSDDNWVNSTPEVFSPGDTLSFRLNVRNSGSAGDSLHNPVVVDLLPVELDFVPGSWSLDLNGINANQPQFTELNDYKSTGRTFLRWEWDTDSMASVPPGEQIEIMFDAVINFNAMPGSPSFSNEFAMLNETTNECSSGYKKADVYDFDEDASTTDQFCHDSIDVNVSAAAALESEKWTKGHLDSVWTKYPNTGSTLPGGNADYQLIIRNTGNVSMRDIIVIDVLPFVGDSAVVSLTERLSRWRPNLVGEVTAPAGVTVYYSDEGNPCRSAEGIVPSGPPSCTAPNWTTTVPADITSVQSLKFDYGSNLLLPGDSLVLEWPMRVPAGVLNTIGSVADSIAWNSFGFIATRDDNSTTLLPSEPFKVGINVNEQLPAVYGDFVWNDTNGDGIQNGGETGIDNIRVELYKDNGDGIQNVTQDTFINFTVTADGGYYLFPLLPVGDYYGVFYVGTNYDPTAMDQGGDDQLDSDASFIIFDDTLVAVMPVTNLTAVELDYSWDLGLTVPGTTGSIGNYVWNDYNQDGLQNEPASAGQNGLTVNLYDNNAPTVIFATTTTSNDLSGNPGYYAFQNVPPGSYFLELILPGTNAMTSQGPTGASDPSDSDFNPANGRTEVFTVVAGVYDDSWDGGFVGEDCSNGIDDDGDGLADCADPDCCCASAPVLSK